MLNQNILDHISRNWASGQFAMANDDEAKLNNGYGITNVYNNPAYSAGGQFANNVATYRDNGFARKQEEQFTQTVQNLLNPRTVEGFDPTPQSNAVASQLNGLNQSSPVTSGGANQSAINMVQQYDSTGQLNRTANIMPIVPANQYTTPMRAPSQRLIVNEEYRGKNMLSIAAVISVIVFILFMLVQLYASQKRIERIISVMRRQELLKHRAVSQLDGLNDF